MKILIQTLGSAGDTHPFVGVGQTLRNRGHDVVLFANEIFRDTVERAGLHFVEMGDADTYRALADRPEVWDRRRGIELILRGVAEHLEESIEIIEGELDGADVIVNSSLGFGARMVRDIHALPLVTAHLAPSLFRSSHRLPRTEIMWVRDSYPMWAKKLWWRLGDFLVDRLVTPELNRARRRRGLQPVNRVLHDWAVYSPDGTIGLFPEWFGPPQPDWAHPVDLVGFPLYDGGGHATLDSELDEWLSHGEPPVVFTAGSANVHAANFFETAANVCGVLGLRGLLVTANKSDIPPSLQEPIRHETHVPFSLLFPSARALVSHGGIGTTAQALAAGIPHLVTHVNFDQRDNASRIEGLGAGLSLSMRRFHGTTAVKAVERVLQPGPAARASDLSRLVDAETARRLAAEAIEGVARSSPR